MEYDRPVIATIWLWITLWKRLWKGLEMRQCRYEIGPNMTDESYFRPS